jgi:hypothetical protein
MAAPPKPAPPKPEPKADPKPEGDEDASKDLKRAREVMDRSL